MGADPLPAGVSCNNTIRRTCRAGTPNAEQHCTTDADCGRAVPQAADCAIGVCKAGTMNAGQACNLDGQCGMPAMAGDCAQVFENGTCGALVQTRRGRFLLSNNHLLGRTNQARRQALEVINLRSQGDFGVGCDASRPVGVFWKLRRLRFGPSSRNRMDAALANISACVPGTPKFGQACAIDADCGRMPAQAGDCGATRMQANGSIRDIGIPTAVNGLNAVDRRGLQRLLFNNVVAAKSGRTTGCTQGRVFAINATVVVGYPGQPDARFKDQILIRSDPGAVACRACVAGTPNTGQPCAADGDCGRMPPAAGDCAPGTDPGTNSCVAGTPNAGSACDFDSDCGRMPPRVGDCHRARIDAGGDSGALWVTWDRRIVDGAAVVHLVPIGLQFAGNEAAHTSIANPIRPVLRALGVSIVGTARPAHLAIVDD